MAKRAFWVLTILSNVVSIAPDPETEIDLFGDLITETGLGANTTCPKYLVELIKHHRVVCGGAVITDSMIITSCECVGRQYTQKTVREYPNIFKVKLSGVSDAMQVNSILLHPLCDTTPDLTSHGTAAVKVEGHIKFGKHATPLSLYSSVGKTLVAQFKQLFMTEEVSCTVVALKKSAAAEGNTPDCKYQGVDTLTVTVRFLSSEECEIICMENSALSCAKDMIERDLFCAELLSGKGTSCDFVPGFPVVCGDSVWGIIPYIDECVPNMIFFYGIRSVAEIYNVAFKFSVSRSCGRTKLETINIVPPEIISRRASSVPPIPAFDGVVLFAVLINLIYYAI